jgi:hypothetical protein
MRQFTGKFRPVGIGRFGWWTVACAATVAIQFAASLAASAAASGGPPNLNVAPSCDAAARGAIVIGRDKDACMADERVAQDQIKKNWSQYSSGDKTQCVGMNRTGGPASYVELLSCLEIMRDARAIHTELSEPLLNNRSLNTRTLVPTDLDEGALYGGDTPKVRHSHKRKHMHHY